MDDYNPSGVRLGDVVDIVREEGGRRAVLVKEVGYDGTVTALPVEGTQNKVYFNTEDVTWQEGSGLEVELRFLEI
jgi:hypothetical protein